MKCTFVFPFILNHSSVPYWAQKKKKRKKGRKDDITILCIQRLHSTEADQTTQKSLPLVVVDCRAMLMR